MANVVLPQVSILNSLANDANLLVEQNGEINRFAVTDLDIGGGDVTIDLVSGINSAANPIDADTLNGYEFDYFASKNDLNDYATAEQVEEIIANLPKDDLDIKLNYSIVGGTTQPTNPTENMIWVETNTQITSYVFKRSEPNNPSNGMIWIAVGDYSTCEFSRILVNEISIDEVCPLYVKQYVNNIWVDKNAKTYQNNKWVDWYIYLFNKGNQNEQFTGGWVCEYSGFTIGTINNDNNLYMGPKQMFGLKKAIPKGNCTTLCFEVISVAQNSSDHGSNFLVSSTAFNTSDTIVAAVEPINAGIYRIDLTNINNFYITMYSYYSDEFLEISKIWLE